MSTLVNLATDFDGDIPGGKMTPKKEPTVKPGPPPSFWDLPEGTVIRSRAIQQKFFDEYFLPNFQYFKKE